MLIIAYSRDERFLARVPFQFDLDSELVEMDRLLDDRKLVLRVTHNLLLSAPQAAWNGRPSTPAEVTLRCTVLRHLMGWSYKTLHDEVVGSAQWHWFCRIYDHSVPNHSTLCDRERLVPPASLHTLNARLVGLGRERKVTQGRQLRTDGTVIETNIHYAEGGPTVACSPTAPASWAGSATKPASCCIHRLRPSSSFFAIDRVVPNDWPGRLPSGSAAPRAKKDSNIIQRGKAAPHETEFGRKLWYSEVDGGIVSDYRILKGNPPDERQWPPSLRYLLLWLTRPLAIRSIGSKPASAPCA